MSTTRQYAGFDRDVQVRQSGDVDWELTEPLTYVGVAGGGVTVPRGFGTDGASVPRFASWLVPRSGRYLPAAVVHDFAYRVLINTRQMTYREADALLREAMRRLGVPALQRGAIWAAVRWAGLFRGRAGRAGWWHDAPRVLAITLLVGWVAIPVSIAVQLGLWIWAALEWLGVAALLAFGRRDHYVNPPRDLTRT